MADSCHGCDVCGISVCQGGCRDYRAYDGDTADFTIARHGCDDDAACLEAWKRAGRPEIRVTT